MATVHPAWNLDIGAQRADLDLRATRLPVAVPLEEARPAVPSAVRLGRGGRLEWNLSRGWSSGQPAPLWDFLRLADGSDDDIGRFARRFGVLGVLPNGLPGCAEGGYPPHEGDGADAWFAEPVEAWRAYARNMRAIVVLAVELRTDDHAIDPHRTLELRGFAREIVRSYTPPLPPPQVPPYVEEFEDGSLGLSTYFHTLAFELGLNVVADNLTRYGTVEHQRQWLGGHVTRVWMRRAALAPVVDWSGPLPGMRLALGDGVDQGFISAWPSNTLFSVLAAQLAAVLRSQHLAVCDDCDVPIERKRKPRSGDPVRCLACAANAKRRATARSARKRRAEGRPT